MPISPARSAAARANGAKSRGPRTPEGKLASSRNATTHGLTARTLVLHNESADDYEADLRDYLDHFRPQGKVETDLVHQIAAASWRLARYAAVESALLDQKMHDQAKWLEEKYEDLDERHRLAVAFESLASNGSLALLNRYQARLHREYQRLIKSITELQTARRAAEAQLSREQKLRNEPKELAPLPLAPAAPPPNLQAGIIPRPLSSSLPDDPPSATRAPESSPSDCATRLIAAGR
jgi:hypothetical protein